MDLNHLCSRGGITRHGLSTLHNVPLNLSVVACIKIFHSYTHLGCLPSCRIAVILQATVPVPPLPEGRAAWDWMGWNGNVLKKFSGRYATGPPTHCKLPCNRLGAKIHHIPC